MTAKKKKIPPVNKITPPDKKLFSVEEYRSLSLIVLAGIILRLIFVIETQNTPFFQNLFSDSKIYYDLALNITSGSWLGDEIFFMSPGYPYFLAVIFTIFGKSILAVQPVQIVVNSINIILIYLIARNLHSKKAGYLSAGIAAVSASLIFYSGSILLEVMQTFLLSVYLVIITNMELIQKSRSWLWAGLCIGIASLFRANILLLLPVMAAWFLLKIVKKSPTRNYLNKSLLYFTIGCIFPVLLVTARNYLVGHDFIFISSNGGINIYLGNNENAPGVYKTPEDFDFFSDLSGRKYAERITGKALTPSGASAFWLQQSINYIEQHPIDWLKLTGKKFLLFFDNNENPQSSIMDPSFFADNYSTVLKLPLPGFFVVFITAVFGFILTWGNRKEYTPIYLFLMTYIISTVIFFIVGRFRIGVFPVFIVFAGIGLTEIYQVIRGMRLKKLIIPTAISALFILGVSFAIPAYNFNNYDAYLNIGNSFFDKHEYDEALLNYQKAASLKADANCYVLLGNTYAAKKDFNQAIESYHKAINQNPAYYLAYFNMGIAYTQIRNLDEAKRLFTKTIELDSTFGEAYRNLAIIDYIKGDYKSSLLYFEKFLSHTTDEQTRKTVMQDIEELKRRIRNEVN